MVALVDIGFKSSTISILTGGELSLSRVVSLGADKLTAGLAEAMGVSYSEAEGIKIGRRHVIDTRWLRILRLNQSTTAAR